jgi:signal transduction histidine kinase
MTDAAVDVPVQGEEMSPFRFSSFRPRQMVGVIGGLLILGLIATAAFTIVRSRNQQLDAAAHELSQLSLTLSEETSRTMQSVGLLLTDVQAQLDVAGVVSPPDLTRIAGTKPFYQYLRDKIRDVHHLDALVIVDRNGRIVNSTRSWPPALVDVSDRDYFEANRDKTGNAPFIGMPVHSRVTGDWIINFSRRINGPDGEFLGVIVGSMQIDYFQEFYRAIFGDSERTVSLFRRDGVLLARYPISESIVGNYYGDRPVFSKLLSNSDSGIAYSKASVIDGQARVIAPYAVRGFPLVVSVTNSESAILASWRRVAWVIMGVTSAAIALIVFLGIMLDRQLRLQLRINETLAERTRADDARQAAEMASKAKSDFLANMSHELRTPLNAIMGFAEMLDSGMFGDLNKKQSEYVQDISMSGRHLLGLINTTLDMAKIEAGRFELHDELIEPGSIFDDAMTFLGMQAKQRGVSLRRFVSDNLPLLLADRRALLQVVLNLLANAINFTKSGGWVTLIASLTEAGGLDIVVTDTGIGINPAAIDRIFEPFQNADASLSRKLGGAGLGLAISKLLIERHGGSIAFKSVVGEGTTVTLTLPVERVVGHRTFASAVFAAQPARIAS